MITQLRRIFPLPLTTLGVVVALALALTSVPTLAQQPGRVTGQVHDEHGAALPNAVVTLSGEQGAVNVVTDDAGRFTFDDVVPGSYSVVSTHDGFIDAETIAEVTAGEELKLGLVMELGFLSEAITVTAERREASLLEVPISITAITGKDRDLLNIISVSDVANITPNMSFNISPNRVTLRGIGRTFNALGMDPGVANYVDGTYTSEVGGSINMNPLFVERTEILRGPQGTLFGRNSVGGLVNVITQRPDSQFNGQFRAFAGEYQAIGGAVTLSGPFTQNGPRYRLNLEASQRGEGYQDNVGSGPEVETFDFYRGEFHLEDDFTDSFRGWMRASYAPYKSSPISGLRRGEYSALAQQLTCCVPNPQWNLTGNPSIDSNEVAIDYPGHMQRTDNPYTIVGELAYTTRPVLIKYLGRWSKYDWKFDIDIDGTNRASYLDPIYGEIFTGGSNFIGEFKEHTSHELQFISTTGSNVSWIAGLFYYDENIEQPFEYNTYDAVGFETPNLAWWLSPTFSPSDPGPPNPNRSSYYQYPELDASQYAAYTQFDFLLASKWTLGVGARYSNDKKTGYEENALFAYNPFAGNYFFEFYHPDQVFTYYGPVGSAADENGRTLDNSWSRVTGKVNLAYQAGTDALVYGSVATGYKSGGFRLGALEENPFVDEETVISYELGYKDLWLSNNSIQFAGALFWNDYRDQQIPVSRLNEANISIQELYNIPKSETGGFELEMTWQPSVGSRLGLNYGYLHSKIVTGLVMEDTSDPAGAPDSFKDVTGNTLQRAPTNQVAAFGAYTFDIFNGGYFTLSGDVSYTDEQHNTPFEGDSWNTFPSYSRGSLRLLYGHPNDAFRVILQVRNVWDAEYLRSVGNSDQDSFFVHTETLMPPRQIFLEFQKSF